MKSFALVLLIGVVACASNDPKLSNSYLSIDRGLSESGEITIATFNIQNLGPTKAGKPDIIAQLAEIIQQFDVVAVQEVIL